MDLGRYGIWWSFSWATADKTVEETAAEVERLGYSTLWSSGGFQPGISGLFSKLLDGTEHLAVATGILSVWMNAPEAIASEARALGNRFVIGLGASHSVVVEAMGDAYDKPFSKVSSWLDAMDELGPAGISPNHRLLAALGPRMLHLAADRAVGAHPYFVPVDHTARARETLGNRPLLAPEVAVVLEESPEAARALARKHTAGYLTLPNYTNNLLTLGFEPSDLENGGSDRLVDAIVPWGPAKAVATRIREHHDAGADHVCVQVIPADNSAFPIAEYRTLAEQLM